MQLSLSSTPQENFIVEYWICHTVCNISKSYQDLKYGPGKILYQSSYDRLSFEIRIGIELDQRGNQSLD